MNLVCCERFAFLMPIPKRNSLRLLPLPGYLAFMPMPDPDPDPDPVPDPEPDLGPDPMPACEALTRNMRGCAKRFTRGCSKAAASVVAA